MEFIGAIARGVKWLIAFLLIFCFIVCLIAFDLAIKLHQAQRQILTSVQKVDNRK